MDKKFCETTNLCLEILKSKRQVFRKLKSATQPPVFSVVTRARMSVKLQDDTKHGCVAD